LPAGHDAPDAGVDGGQQGDDDPEDEAERDQRLDNGEPRLSLQGSFQEPKLTGIRRGSPGCRALRSFCCCSVGIP
jgi:hypothetical protein